MIALLLAKVTVIAIATNVIIVPKTQIAGIMIITALLPIVHALLLLMIPT